MNRDIINEYSTIGECPQGNMALTEIGVYQGKKVILKKLVPRLRNKPIFEQRWNQEIVVTNYLSQYINVPKVVGYGNTPILWYMQQYIEGMNLRQWIQQQHYPLCIEKRKKAISISLQLLEMIEKMDKLGVVHRDLTPENVMVDKNNKIYIIDWGLAYIKGKNQFDFDVLPFESFSQNRLTEYGRRHGKVGYACPEQYDAHNDTPSIKNDIYSVVMMLIEMIKGATLFDNYDDYDEIILLQKNLDSRDKLYKIINDDFLASLFPFLVGNEIIRNKCLDDLKNWLIYEKKGMNNCGNIQKTV